MSIFSLPTVVFSSLGVILFSSRRLRCVEDVETHRCLRFCFRSALNKFFSRYCVHHEVELFRSVLSVGLLSYEIDFLNFINRYTYALTCAFATCFSDLIYFIICLYEMLKITRKFSCVGAIWKFVGIDVKMVQK